MTKHWKPGCQLHWDLVGDVVEVFDNLLNSGDKCCFLLKDRAVKYLSYQLISAERSS